MHCCLISFHFFHVSNKGRCFINIYIYVYDVRMSNHFVFVVYTGIIVERRRERCAMEESLFTIRIFLVFLASFHVYSNFNKLAPYVSFLFSLLRVPSLRCRQFVKVYHVVNQGCIFYFKFN